MTIVGSDVASIRTTAVLSPDKRHYIVNGSKKWITNAIWADYVTAAVRTGGPGAAGVSLLIIPLKAAGVTTRQMHNSGVGASGSTFITFEDVAVPVENLLHKENRGFEVIMSNFNAERKSIATSAIRLSRVCAEDAWRHACTRETFGHKLIELCLEVHDLHTLSLPHARGTRRRHWRCRGGTLALLMIHVSIDFHIAIIHITLLALHGII